MGKHPVTNYIEQAQNQGMTNEQIIGALTNAGWHVREVLEVVLEHGVPNVTTLPQKETATTSAEDNIIAVEGISKSYGKVQALDNVSLNVRRGKVTAILGPNGAGKTTLVRILATLLNPSSGTATVNGFDAVRDAQTLRAIIGLAGQYAAVDETLTGRENLEMVGRLYHLSKQEAKQRAINLLKRFELEDTADRVTKTYSGGMRRRLDLAASLVIHPKILFLDEPTTGLDPSSRFTLWQIIRELVEEGTTVLLTTQYMEEADQLANYIFVIDHGHIIAQGTPNELKRQVGGDVLELHVSKRETADKVAELVQQFSTDKPHVDTNTGIVTVPISGGASILVDVVKQLGTANVQLADIILRRPSLDDVFIKLTGHDAQ